MRVLAISGSLRAGSSNTALLHAAQRVAPPGVEVESYAGLGGLPIFNPDLDELPPPQVTELRQKVRSAGALLICSPEYARGVAGGLKNALDWLVSMDGFVGKRVVVVNASPRATDANAQLRIILATMAADLGGEASLLIPLPGREWDAERIASDPVIAGQLRSALAGLAHADP